MPTLGIIALLLLGAAIIVTAGYAGLRAAPWVPTWKTDVRRFLALAELAPGKRFVDLGCGDGRLVFTAAKAGADATGYEISLLPYLIALLHRAFLPSEARRRAGIRYRDFWNADLRNADVLYTFLMPEHKERLRKKFEAELRPGTIVITYVWPLDGWTPVATDTEPGRLKLFKYRIAR
jgi:SAM-dependent methyltransferase